MERVQKEALVASMNQTFKDAGVVVVAHYNGLNVAEMTDLRVKMAEAGASFRVAKNSLTKLALEGTDAIGLKDLFQGPTAVAYSADPVSAPKIAVNFAKDHENLVILGGSMGAGALDPAGVKTLASLPTLDELHATIAGMINRPATKVATILQAPAGQLARVFGAYANEGNAA